MNKRKAIYNKIIANNKRIEKLQAENIELQRQSFLLSDKKQWFTEQERTYGRGKVSIIGCINWLEYYTDEDNGQKIEIERARVVRINGEWV